MFSDDFTLRKEYSKTAGYENFFVKCKFHKIIVTSSSVRWYKTIFTPWLSGLRFLIGTSPPSCWFTSRFNWQFCDSSWVFSCSSWYMYSAVCWSIAAWNQKTPWRYSIEQSCHYGNYSVLNGTRLRRLRRLKIWKIIFKAEVASYFCPSAGSIEINTHSTHSESILAK